jgi:three-Cys-motif partner protein
MPRRVGEWTRDKLKILELYLAGYLQATTRTRERIYIDGFAGPGTNQVRSSTRDIIDGSPLIALKARARNGTRFSRLYFIENDPLLAEELEATLRNQGNDDRWQVIHGDVNEKLPEVVHKQPRHSPIFIFLDTVGIDPRWTTIEMVAPWQVEFLINVPIGMSMKRNWTSSKNVAYFGTDECLSILRSERVGRDRELLDLYKRQLAGLGLLYSPVNDRLIRTQANHSLYYLLLASKVPAAETIMTWVFNQPGFSGQAPLQL